MHHVGMVEKLIPNISSLSILEIETEIFHVDISISGEKICCRQVCVIDLSPNCVFKVNCCNIIYSLEIQ